MDEQRLYRVIDFILNQAEDSEIEVIVAALKKRLSDSVKGPMGLDPGKMAKALAKNVNNQVKQSIDQMHGNIQDYLAALIKREVPDIPDEHLKELLETWAPKPGAKRKPGSGSNVPSDVLITMIRQFLSYSLGMMSVTEQKALHDSIPGWQEEYWRRFPDHVRALLSKVLKGEIDEDYFWERIESETGLDGGRE